MRPLILLSLLAALPAGAAELRLGAPVPEFTLRDTQGRSIGPGELQAPVVIIEFWATWCAPCRSALPSLARLAHRYAPQVQLVAINIDSERAVADRFLDTYLPTRDATLLFDPDNRLMAEWGAPGMPTIAVAVRGSVGMIESGYSEDKLQAIDTFVGAALRLVAGTPTP